MDLVKLLRVRYAKKPDWRGHQIFIVREGDHGEVGYSVKSATDFVNEAWWCEENPHIRKGVLRAIRQLGGGGNLSVSA